MAISSNHEHRENKDSRLYADHRARKTYLNSLKNASITGFPTRSAEEIAIQSGRDYSTWILSAADCDLFMHSLLNTPKFDPRSRASFHRRRRRHD